MNAASVWIHAKKQTWCWLATGLYTLSIMCFAISNPPHPPIWWVAAAGIPLFSLAVMWYAVVTHSMRQARQGTGGDAAP